jgi:hypothetical protein
MVRMAQVDPQDDSTQRFIVWHYAYDPARRERRNQVVAAFDNYAEFEQYIGRANAELRIRQSQHGVDPKEHFGGVVKPPGHDAAKRTRREAMWRLRQGTATEQDIADLGSAVSISRLQEGS